MGRSDMIADVIILPQSIWAEEIKFENFVPKNSGAFEAAERTSKSLKGYMEGNLILLNWIYLGERN